VYAYVCVFERESVYEVLLDLPQGSLTGVCVCVCVCVCERERVRSISSIFAVECVKKKRGRRKCE